MTKSSSHQLRLDWQHVEVSRHEQLSIIACAQQLLSWFGEGALATTNLIIPLDSGRKIYSLKPDIIPCDTHRIVFRDAKMEISSPMEYGDPQAFDLVCRESGRSLDKSFQLTGSMTPFVHAALLTGLRGRTIGVDLAKLGAVRNPTRRFTLKYVVPAGPDLVDAETGAPVFCDTLGPFLDRLRADLREREQTKRR